jgi:hypothetical protein
MKFEVGKFYKTRNGQKVEVLKINRNNAKFPVLAWFVNKNHDQYYCQNGNFFECESESCYDLIEEWRDKLDNEFFVTRRGLNRLMNLGDNSSSDESIFGKYSLSSNGLDCVRVRITEL